MRKFQVNFISEDISTADGNAHLLNNEHERLHRRNDIDSNNNESFGSDDFHECPICYDELHDPKVIVHSLILFIGNIRVRTPVPQGVY